MEEREKLDQMAARIRQAKGEVRAEEAAAAAVPLKASRIGFDFIGAVLACTFLGWLADQGLGTKPWGLISMILIGFGVGIMNVWRAMQKSEDKDQKAEN